MINSKRETAVDGPPVGHRRLWQVVMAASLVPLGAGVVHPGLRSFFGSAPPGPVLPSAAAQTIKQSVPSHAADADADVGPGEVEPVLVGAQ